MSKRKPARTIKGAVCIQDPFAGSRQRSAHGASGLEAGVGAGTAVRTERRQHRHRHALHGWQPQPRCALPGCRGAQEARAQAGVGEEDGERVYRIVACKASGMPEVCRVRALRGTRRTPRSRPRLLICARLRLTRFGDTGA